MFPFNKFSRWLIPELRTIAIFLIFAFSLAVRLLCYRQVFTDYGFFPPTDDPPYHLKRILYILQNFPHISYFDHAVNFPEGAYVIWHYGFDLTLAAISFLFSGFSPTEESVFLICSITIPVLGAITAIFVFLLAEKIAGRFVSVVAALLFALLPAHHDYSFVGRVDHHAMEPLLVAMVVFFLARNSIRKRVNSIMAGIFLGSMLFFFPTAIHFLLLFYVAYAFSFFMRQRDEIRDSAIPLLAAAFIVVCAAVLTSPFRSSFVFYSPSLLHIAISFFGLAFTVIYHLLKGRGARQFAIAGGCVAAMAAVLSFSSPEFPASISEGLKYSFGNPMTELSFEAESLFLNPQRFTLLTGGAVILLPIGIIMFFLWSFRSRGSLPDLWGSSLFLILFVLMLLLSTVFQRRFLVALSPFIAIFTGVTCAYLKGLFEKFGLRRWLAQTTAAVLIFAIQTPAISHLISMKIHTDQDLLVFKSLNWLKNYDEKNVIKDYSVMAPWHYGHLITFMTGIPNIANNFFGIPVHDKGIAESIRFFFTLDTNEVHKIVKNRKIRYIFMVPTPRQALKTYFKIAGLDESAYFTEKGELKVEYTQTMEYQLGVLNGEKFTWIKPIYDDMALDESRRALAHAKIFEVQ